MSLKIKWPFSQMKQFFPIVPKIKFNFFTGIMKDQPKFIVVDDKNIIYGKTPDAIVPCPDCGGVASCHKFLRPNAYEVSCNVCDFYLGYFDTASEAIADWNEFAKSKK